MWEERKGKKEKSNFRISYSRIHIHSMGGCVVEAGKLCIDGAHALEAAAARIATGGELLSALPILFEWPQSLE